MSMMQPPGAVNPLVVRGGTELSTDQDPIFEPGVLRRANVVRYDSQFHNFGRDDTVYPALDLHLHLDPKWVAQFSAGEMSSLSFLVGKSFAGASPGVMGTRPYPGPDTVFHESQRPPEGFSFPDNTGWGHMIITYRIHGFTEQDLFQALARVGIVVENTSKESGQAPHMLSEASLRLGAQQ